MIHIRFSYHIISLNNNNDNNSNKIKVSKVYFVKMYILSQI